MSSSIRKQFLEPKTLILLILLSSVYALQAFNETTPASSVPPATTVRLVGKNSYQGLVEVYVDGQWGNICDSNFGTYEAKVVCRQLGYDRAEKYITDAATIYNMSPREVIFFDRLDCDGQESSLEECYYQLRVDTSCSKGYHGVAGVKCDTESVSNDILTEHFNLLGWGIFFGFLMVGFAIGGRRYRHRVHRNGGGLQTNTVSATVYANQMPVIPPPSNHHSALPPGSYPTQLQQPYQTNLQMTDGTFENTNSELPSDGNPALSSAWSQSGHYLPPSYNGMPYQQQLGGAFYPPASSPQYCNGGQYPFQTTSGFPPNAPGENEYTPNMPPPSYESISQGNDQAGKNDSTVT